MERCEVNDGRLTLSEFLFQASAFRAFYWRIRASRSHKDLRRWYRAAAKEKGRLAALGVDPDVVRLYGLYLRNPRLEYRFDRFAEAFAKTPKCPVQLSLF